MSLIGALNVGKSALAVQQAALQVTGNNIANAGNENYTRQVARMTPTRDRMLRPGMFMGTGVQLDAVQRQIDQALENRLRASISDNQSALANEQWLGRVEAIYNELGSNDLSTQMSTFFRGWSNLANKPQDMGLRQIVLQNGDSLASQFRSIRGQLSELQVDVDGKVDALVKDADGLTRQIAELNRQISLSEGGGGQANGLRDQRDAVIKKLSELIDINTIQQDNGSVTVFVGSEPLVENSTSYGVGMIKDTDPSTGEPRTRVVFKSNNGDMQMTAGQLGGLLQVKKSVDAAADSLDSLANNLIFELNKVHAGGQGLIGFSTVTGTNGVDDPTLALNDPDNGLDFTPTNGSFVVHVKQKATGQTISTLVQVDLDGLNGNDTSLTNLATSLDGITGLNASVVGGKLRVNADGNTVDFSFSQDTSGTLAALGVNNFYSGSTALDIAVNEVVKTNPKLLAASKNGELANNETALAVAALETATLPSLGGSSLKESYESMINGLSVQASAAKNNAEASDAVLQTLAAQREALSGVSLDEEAINLMRQQRAFQGASRLIATVNELMDQVLSLV